MTIFGDRIAEKGNDPAVTTRALRGWLDRWSRPTQIIVGSARGVRDVQSAAAARAHAVTVPPEILAKLVDHRPSRETVRLFVADSRTATETIARLTRTAR